MNARQRPSRLFGFDRAARAPAEPDAADLGTAFGMEVSLDQPPEPAAAGNEAATRPGWLRRLARRRERKA